MTLFPPSLQLERPRRPQPSFPPAPQGPIFPQITWALVLCWELDQSLPLIREAKEMWRSGWGPAPYEGERGVAEIGSVWLAPSGLTSPTPGGVFLFLQPTSTWGHLETSGSCSLDLGFREIPSFLNP